MSSFLDFICIRHKWLIYVILWGYAYSIHTIGWIVEDLIPRSADIIFILLNPVFIFVIPLDLSRIFYILLIANLMLWMPIAFAIQMYVIRKYRKRNSKELVSMSITGKAIRIVAITVIGLTYIWFIWHPWLS